jgi:hypothetical protein
MGFYGPFSTAFSMAMFVNKGGENPTVVGHSKQ